MTSANGWTSRFASSLACLGFSLGLCVSGAVSAASLTAQLVKDVNDLNMPSAGSGPVPIGQLASGIELLTAYKPTTGRELYRLDVATGNVSLIKDINPGPGSPSIQYVTIVNGLAFFQAFTSREGWELWRSDGTAAGTWLVKDIWPGVGGSYPATFMQLHGALYFGACSDVGACGLWRSDGTESGTTLVKPGLTVSSGSVPNGAEYSGRLYFSGADSSGAGYELWSTDGTTAGTVLVKDIFPGSSYGYAFSSSPGYLVVAGGALFFSARDTNGIELWKSDGTSAGTLMVRDLFPGNAPWGDANSGWPAELAAIQGQLVFTASGPTGSRYFWRSDGTEGGTVRLRDATGGVYPCSNAFVDYAPPATVAGSLFLAAGENTTGCELWKTDGTDVGTVLVKDIWPGTNYYGYGNDAFPRSVTVVSGTVFLTAMDGVHGRELWKSDGTEAGTELVRDISPSPDPYGFYGPWGLAAAGPLLLFAADDGTTGSELWRSDGTSAGTSLVKDIWVSTGPSLPRDAVEMHGAVYFVALSEDRWGLWKSDGTAGGTARLMVSQDVNCWPAVGQPVVVGETLFFYACNAGRADLWKSDGTAAGTALVASFEGLDALTAYRGEVYFSAYTYADGGGLWKSNGTSTGTVRVRGALNYVTQLTVVGDTLFFTADATTTGTELWKSDGTEAGTVLVKDIFPGMSWGTYPNSSYPRHLKALGERQLLFFAWTPDGGAWLWRSDGTEAGTQLVKEIGPMPEDSDDLYGQGAPLFTEYQGKLWFVAWDPDGGCEPWSTDGTAVGTTRLRDIFPGSGSSCYSYFMWGVYPRYSGPRFGVLDGNLYFGAFSGGSGFELWRSDGTESGTDLVKDLLPGDGSVASLFDSFTSAGGALYFIGCKSNGYDSFKDCNLWKTDGTAAGTEPALATPLSFDGGSYYFNGNNRMTVAGGSLYVPATDDEHGAELFRVPLVVDPVQLLSDLYREVAHVSPGSSLSSKVAQAQASLEKGNLRSACGAVGAFSNEVTARRGKLLSRGTADALISDAQAVRTVIGCK